MKNTFTNFDINERARKSIFINRNGDWTSFTSGMGSINEQLGCYIPEFIVFVEIYDLDGELILNYPIEQCAEEKLEEVMRQQVIRYGQLIENVGISTVAVETSLVTTVEWFALKQFKAPEFIVFETLERAGRLAESDNEQLSYLDLITKFENNEAGIEPSVAPIQETQYPALCENPWEFQIVALPVVMRAKSMRINPDNNKEGEVDAADSAANSNDTAEPLSKNETNAVPVQNEYSAPANTSAIKLRRALSRLQNITGIIYALLSWTLLILSIWTIKN